ncbi:tRNA(Ile)-lysidine synthetase [hydrothermal vent metagenome]|uniref:tRNA(Ile)-lysidine synthetase n=1 Tax=hydrothermal vent metagenome TaxID=652676 RepID=A0A3B0VT55_9ZZZZ
MSANASNENFLPPHLVCFSEVLEAFMHQYSDFSRIYIAFSGGLDSTVLLHLLSQSSNIKGRLIAHHVNHDLQESASDWVKHCKSLCLSLNVLFKSSKLQWPSTKREGVESVARRLRYQALTKGCSLDVDVLVTGHHQRDQAETVLLNLARGAGVSGLAAMPILKELSTTTGSVMHCRPLLHTPYQKLKEYAKHFKLPWIEDPSNAETFYRRNAIRQEVLPVLSVYWPEIERTLARTADNMSEAHILLNRMAEQTLAKIKSFEFYFDFDLLTKLDWLEQKNVLRYWLFKRFNITLSVRHYAWIKDVLAQQSKSRKNAFSYQMRQGELCFFKNRLYCLKHKLLPYFFKGITVFESRVLGCNQDAAWVLSLHDGRLSVNSSSLLESSLYYHWKIEASLVFRLSEMVVRNVSKEDDLDRKKLKSFFQQNKIPVWERPFWPVLTYDGVIVGVLGCFYCVKSSDKHDLVTHKIEEKGGEKNFQQTVLLSVSQRECYRIMRGIP